MPRPSKAILEAEIRAKLRRHLADVGFVRAIDGSLTLPGSDKDTLRAMHAAQRAQVLKSHQSFITENWPRLRKHFASGSEVDPAQIWPRLELVESKTWQSDLFRLAALTWSIPVSQGYGRRMRFLVWDETNEKLIGLIALGDPVFNLRVRDDWIGWTAEQRATRLVNVMDAYVLGSLPPYSNLLGGKLVASLVKTSDVREMFADRYGNARGLISGQRKRASLALVTTTSAFGKSSVYNRLTLDGYPLFKALGYTKGFGHFHVPDSLFSLIREYLTLRRHSYARNFQYGEGPNWRMRATRKAFELAGLNPMLLRHGVQREVFVAELATNAREYLRGEHRKLELDQLLSVSEVGLLVRERWMVPRAERDSSYSEHSSDRIAQLLTASTYRLRSGALAGTGTHGLS